MAASSDSDKKFMALVTESDSGTTIKKIQNEPGTVQETKIKLKAQKLEVKATKQRLKDMKNAEIESSTRGFKRPLWAQANRMTVVMNSKRKEIDVAITDTWADVKSLACEAMEVREADKKMKIVFDMPTTKVVKKRMYHYVLESSTYGMAF